MLTGNVNQKTLQALVCLYDKQKSHPVVHREILEVERMLVAGDIGGTKTILAIYSSETSPHQPIVQKLYHSDKYESLGAMVRDFLQETKLPVQYGCFAVAGPVINGHAKLTNLPWGDLEEQSLCKELSFTTVRIMNDLEAIANSIPYLVPQDIYTLNKGRVVANGAIGVIAPGTGLGEAYLTWDGLEYRAHASEGGHVNFAPSNETELKLLQYLWKQYPHVSVERVCSGIGMPNIYAFYKAQGYAEREELAELLREKEEQHRTEVIIAEAMKANPDPLCAETVRTFARILGAEAGNHALKHLATGGIYITGGVATHVLPYLSDGAFMSAFQRKGRFADFLGNISIQVILTSAGLLGAASYGMKLVYHKIK